LRSFVLPVSPCRPFGLAGAEYSRYHKYNGGVCLGTKKGHSFIFALLMFVVLLWGINVVMIKYLTKFYPPLALAPIRLFLASCLLLPVVSCKQGYVKPSPTALRHIVALPLSRFFSIKSHYPGEFL
jgi:hypothetical protein